MAPPKRDTMAMTLRLDLDVVAKLDELRRQETDIPTRPEMIRRIIHRWLDDQTRKG